MEIQKLTEEQILKYAIKFALETAPPTENGGVSSDDFRFYRDSFKTCLKWLIEDIKKEENKTTK